MMAYDLCVEYETNAESGFGQSYFRTGKLRRFYLREKG
jgi:hypothetical protein